MFFLSCDFRTIDSTWIFFRFIRVQQRSLFHIFISLVFIVPMVFIVAASCLDRAINAADRSIRLSIHRRSFSVPGLSFNPRSESKFKDLGFLLDRGSLKYRKNFVLWHDVINNSITSHRSNNNEPCGIGELTEILKKHEHRFSAILYCRRMGTENIFDELRSLGILIVDVKRRFLSKRKQKKMYFKTELLKLHPSPAIEARFIRQILKHDVNIYILVLQQRSKSRKRNKSERRKEPWSLQLS